MTSESATLAGADGDPPTGADVVVIGAGIVGAAVASELAGDHDVLVIEAEAQPDRHATGRSAAVWRLIYGDPVVSELIAAGRELLERPPEEFSELSFLRSRPVLYVARPGEEGAADALFAQGSAMQPALSRLDPDEVEADHPALRPGLVDAFVDPTGADIDVAGLHQAYLRRLRRRGGRLDLNRRAIGLRYVGSRGGSGGRGGNGSGHWRIDTGEGAITAGAVVNAAGAWGDEVASSAGVSPVGLVPMRRTVITFDPGSLRDDDGPMVVSVTNRFYAKPETGIVLASPFDEHPDHPHNVKPAEVDVALLLDRLAEATTYEAVNGRRSIRSSWAGLRTFSPDRRPVLGWDPDHPGFFWAVGLGGFGIETAPGVAELCARLFRHPTEAPPDPFAASRFR